MAKNFMVALERTLNEFSKEENEIMFNCMSKAMKKAKADVINLSPKKSKDYSRGWAIRTKRLKYGFQGVIYNKTHAGLTHLLEHGHLVKNGTGRIVGQADPHPHIIDARDIAETYLVDLLVEAHE